MVGRPTNSAGAAFALAALLLAGCHSGGEVTPEAALLRAVDAPTTPRAGLPSSGPRTEPGQPNRAAPPARTQVAGAGAAQPPASPIQQTAAQVPADGPKVLPTLPPAQAVVTPAPGPPALTFPASIELGLTQNPDLVTLRGTENVGRAVLGVARTPLFNPTVQTRILPYNRTQEGTNAATYNYVLVWQQFEMAFQRRFRTQNAAAALDATRWNIQQAELQNIALTEQLYFAALYQHGLSELAERTARVNDTLLAVMEKRLQAGQASAADVAMVRFDTRSSRQQAQLAVIGFQNALLALRRQLNLSPEAPLCLQGDLAEFVWHPVNGPEMCRLMGDGSVFTSGADADAVAAELAARRPDVLAAQANVAAAQANLRLARASRVPNMWLGPFYSRDSEAIVSLGLQAQMDIPVVNTGKPLVHQREAEAEQQANALHQLMGKARVEARTAVLRYERARGLAEQTRGISGQQLPEELQKLEAEFNRGEIDILRITQARNSLIAFRRTYLDTLNEVALAAGAVTAATGLPPAALVSPPGAPACLPQSVSRQEPERRPEATISFQAAE